MAPSSTVQVAQRPIRPAAVVTQQFSYVVVTLPQDAVLYLGGHRTSTTGTVRKFKIPVTAEAVQAPYDVKVVLERNGQSYVAMTQERLVVGQTTNVNVKNVTGDYSVAAR